MKYLLILFLAAATAHAAPPALDPFGAAGRPSWTAEINRQKPLRLSIACAETTSALPTDPAKPPGDSGSYILTDEFLKKAKITSIAVAENDLGSLTRNDGIEIQYRVKNAGEYYVLSLELNTVSPDGDKRGTNTELNVPTSAWHVITVLSREETKTFKNGKTTGDKRYYSIAVRIDPPASAK